MTSRRVHVIVLIVSICRLVIVGRPIFAPFISSRPGPGFLKLDRQLSSQCIVGHIHGLSAPALGQLEFPALTQYRAV